VDMFVVLRRLQWQPQGVDEELPAGDGVVAITLTLAMNWIFTVTPFLPCLPTSRCPVFAAGSRRCSR
jgi:hypothetical protein